MAITLFISEQYIKDNTPIPTNLDVKLIIPHLAFVQDTYVQNILGSKLYNTIQLHFSGQTLDTYETELVSLIKPALAYRASEAALPFMHIQMRNAGTVKLNADNATVQSSMDEMIYLREILKGRAEFYEKQVVTYLTHSGDNFADYIKPDVTGILPSKKSPTTCDLYFESYGSTVCRCGTLNCNGLCGFYN